MRCACLLVYVCAVLCSIQAGARAQTINEAVQQGNLARVRRLLASNPRLANFVGPDGNQPLHLAAGTGNEDIVRALIAARADVNGVGSRQDHFTPLFNAAQQGRPEIARLLLANGANVDARDSLGNTPLAFAADNHADVAEVLLAAGANVNARRDTQDGWSPIFTAVDHDAVEAMRVLLRHGADPEIRSNNGNAAIHIAADRGYVRPIALLVSAGQSIDTPNADGNTPLMVAAWYGQVGVGRFLIGAGADINIHNKAGRTALDEALRNHQTAFADLIHNYQVVLEAHGSLERAAALTGARVRSGYLNWPMPGMQAQRVYSNKFSSDRVGPEWTTLPQQGAQQAELHVATTPRGGRRFLGELGSQTARLTLANLPAHRAVSLMFDLYILGGWEGNNLNSGPDVWTLSLLDGPMLLRTTFANSAGVFNANVHLQAYPGTYPGDHYGCGTGTTEANALGYMANVEGQQIPADSVYRLSYTVAHTGPTLTLDFSATGLQGLDSQGWGLANLQVSVAVPSVVLVRPASPVRHIVRSIGSSVGAATRAVPDRPHPHPAPTRAVKKRPTGATPKKRLHPKETPPGL
jgi:ankyrin repeat protein